MFAWHCRGLLSSLHSSWEASSAIRSDSSASLRNCCSWPSSWICTSRDTISWMVAFLLISGNFILRRSKLESFLRVDPSGNCSRTNSSALASNLVANSGANPGETFIISVTVFSLKDMMLVFTCWFGLSTSACWILPSKISTLINVDTDIIFTAMGFTKTQSLAVPSS